jgi:hypothetical protein
MSKLNQLNFFLRSFKNFIYFFSVVKKVFCLSTKSFNFCKKKDCVNYFRILWKDFDFYAQKIYFFIDFREFTLQKISIQRVTSSSIEPRWIFSSKIEYWKNFCNSLRVCSKINTFTQQQPRRQQYRFEARTVFIQEHACFVFFSVFSQRS